MDLRHVTPMNVQKSSVQSSVIGCADVCAIVSLKAHVSCCKERRQ